MLLVDFPFWFGAACELQLASCGQATVSQYKRQSLSDISLASEYIFQVWHEQSGHTWTTY